jgi:cytochrome P450
MTYAAKTAAAGGSSEGSGDAQRHPIRFIIFHAKDGRAHFFRSALENPYPLYAELRDQAAAVRLRPLGMYALPRYQTVRDALQDWQTF